MRELQDVGKVLAIFVALAPMLEEAGYNQSSRRNVVIFRPMAIADWELFSVRRQDERVFGRRKEGLDNDPFQVSERGFHGDEAGLDSWMTKKTERTLSQWQNTRRIWTAGPRNHLPSVPKQSVRSGFGFLWAGLCEGQHLRECLPVMSTVPSDGRGRWAVRDFPRTDGTAPRPSVPSLLHNDGMTADIGW